jgi:hypothetical protein
VLDVASDSTTSNEAGTDSASNEAGADSTSNDTGTDSPANEAGADSRRPAVLKVTSTLERTFAESTKPTPRERSLGADS